MRGKRPGKDDKPKVPAYIVTFSDMVTLLLTFFVMLLSLASVQDEVMFNIGRDSFVEAIQKFGLGMFTGAKVRPGFDYVKHKYFIDKSDKSLSSRTIDAKEEAIRRSFIKVRRSARAIPSQMVGKKTDFSLTDINFSPGLAVLDKSSKNFLTRFAAGVQQNSNASITGLYVLGLATEGAGYRERYLLSARRAQATADFLGQLLPATSFGPIRWWGAGAGGDWVGRGSSISKESQILIAILRAND